PIRGDAGSLAGLLVAAYDSEALEQRIARPGSGVSVTNGDGGLIASRDEIPPGLPRRPPLPAGWDRAVREGRPMVGQVGGVAGFAVVPGIDWVVAVERPRAAALAGVRRGRDLAFLLLLAVVPVAVLFGILAARRIARPLQTLSGAVDELTAGNL